MGLLVFGSRIEDPAAVSERPEPVSGAPEPAATEAPPPPERPPESVSEEDSWFAELFPPGDPAWAWSRVDLEALREELPNNRYFELAVPTDDPEILAQRRETKERWNRELGKVMANTATEAEVRAYYAERQEISSDYVIFTTTLLDRYRDVLPEQDVGLLELARTLHRARLEELPRRLAEAIERRDAHEIVREQWLADQAAFGDEPEGDPGDPDGGNPE